MPIAEQIVTDQVPKTGSAEGVSVTVIQNWNELMRFRDAWEGLLEEVAAPSIFLTPEWMGAWWEAFRHDQELVCLIFRDAQQIVAIAPLYRERIGTFPFRRSRLRLVGAGSGDSDALDFIVKPGCESRVATAFLRWLDDHRDWAICSLETLPQNSTMGIHLVKSLKQLRWSVLSDDSVNYVIDLPPTWQAYLQSLDPKFRPLLTRYPKRLQTRYQGVRISRLEDASQMEASLGNLFELHQMRWTGRGEAGAFASAERRAFYAQMADAFLRRGWLEFWRLEIEGRTVAAQFCFRYRDTVSLLQEGFDPKYAADKIGYALRAHVLEAMIQSGARHYDFLGGSDSYKPKFGARAGSYLSLHFSGPSLMGRASLARQRYAKGLRRWLKSALPQRWLAAIQRPQRPAVGAENT